MKNLHSGKKSTRDIVCQKKPKKRSREFLKNIGLREETDVADDDWKRDECQRSWTTLRDARPRRRSLSSEPGVLLLANIMVISVTASATLAVVRARPPRARPTAAAASREGPRSRSRCVPARRRVTAAAAEEDPLVENVERAAGLLDLIIKETVEQVFVEEAVEEVIPGDDDADADAAATPSSAPAAEVDKEAILRSVVRKHLGELDGSFMAALSAYVQVAESSGDFALLSMLAAIREEVLAAVTGEMQPDIQVVQLVSRLKSREQRVEVLRAAHAGGGTVAGMDVPAASIEAVETVAARLVDEMESQERVPNWQLLWQLLLVRETARQLHPKCDDDGVFGATVVSRSFSPSEIPKAEAAMIKELCVVNESRARRAAALATLDECRALDEARDADGGKIKLKRSTRGFRRRNDTDGGDDGSSSMDVFDVRDVRPGRLIDCVINMRVALAREDADARVVDRLAEIYFECCDVLLEQADKGARSARADEKATQELGE